MGTDGGGGRDRRAVGDRRAVEVEGERGEGRAVGGESRVDCCSPCR